VHQRSHFRFEDFRKPVPEEAEKEDVAAVRAPIAAAGVNVVVLKTYSQKKNRRI
jgi:hypothetical protein